MDVKIVVCDLHKAYNQNNRAKNCYEYDDRQIIILLTYQVISEYIKYSEHTKEYMTPLIGSSKYIELMKVDYS